MMLIEAILRVVAGIVLLAGNAFFVTTEFALTRVRQFDESEFTDHAGLRRAWDMTDELEIYLSGCQVGITICSVALGVVAEPAIAVLLGDVLAAVGLVSSTSHSAVTVIVALTLINLAHVVFGEQIPTYLGVERTKLITRYLAPLLYGWAKVMGPVIRFADWLSKSILGVFGVTITRAWTEGEDEEQGEPRTLSDVKRELGAMLSGTHLSDERKEEVLNALDISSIPVGDIMIPADEIRAPSTAGSLDETLEYIESQPHTRYPLLDTEKDMYIGTIYTAAILQNLSELEAGEMTLQDVAEELTVVSPDTPVSEVIDQFQRERQELALVADMPEKPLPKQDVQGLVTTTDAFESIAGDMEDPMDEESAATP